MLTLTCTAALDAALADPDFDPALRALLAARAAQLAEDVDDDLDLGDVAHLHVAAPGDALPDVEAALGVALAPGHPPWEWADDHGGWLEAALVASDDGFGHVLFVPDAPGTDPALLALLRAHAAAA